jgi:hypothetical protein
MTSQEPTLNDMKNFLRTLGQRSSQVQNADEATKRRVIRENEEILHNKLESIKNLSPEWRDIMTPPELRNNLNR